MFSNNYLMYLKDKVCSIVIRVIKLNSTRKILKK